MARKYNANDQTAHAGQSEESRQQTDWSSLNFIKSDVKMQQRQQEIIQVLIDMSFQISKSIEKNINSFISQLDGHKPVFNNQDVQYVSNMSKEGQNGENQSDISQQIFEVHGQRVKKYAIYIENLIDKLKALQGVGISMFDTIGQQLIALIQSQHEHMKKDQMKQELKQMTSSFKDNLNEVQQILESYFEEEQVLFQAGLDMGYQEQQFQQIKLINDQITANLVRLMKIFSSLQTGAVIQQEQDVPQNQINNRLPNNKQSIHLLNSIVSSRFESFTGQLKEEIKSFTQSLIQKQELMKNDGCKLLINGQVSKSGMPFEVKSQNVMVFR